MDDNLTKQVHLTVYLNFNQSYKPCYFSVFWTFALNRILFFKAEEVEALSSIYGDDWTTESDLSKSYNIKIQEGNKQAILYVTMPPKYPSQSPPKYEFSAPWMDRKAKENLHSAVDEVYS